MDLLSKNKSLSGIYLIQNTLDSKVYVGSSIDIERRWSDHKNLLSRSKHHSKHLQNAWNKYGVENFEFKIIELVNEPTILVEREQFWMDSIQSYDPQLGYNASTTANIFVNSEFLVAQPSKTKDWIVISPQGEKIFVRNLSAFCRENGLNRTSMVNVASGKTLTYRGWKCQYAYTPKHQDRPSKRFKNYVVTDTDGNSQKVTNLKLFCEQMGLDLAAMYSVASGNRSTYKGWTCQYVDSPKPLKVFQSTKEWIIVSPDAEIFEINNLRQFCKNHGLNDSAMIQIAKGKLNHYKGWLCSYSDSSMPIKTLTQQKEWLIITPDGEELPVSNLNSFCKTHKLDSGCMVKVAQGKFKQHKGYRCYRTDRPIPTLISEKFSKSDPVVIEKPEKIKKKVMPISQGEKLRQIKSNSWVVISPDGKEQKITNLAKFCREHGLDQGHMSKIAQGKGKSHKGWSCRKID